MDDHVRILPYCTRDGIPTMRDSDLAEMFCTMRDHGFVPVVFWDKSVVDAPDFVRRMKGPHTRFFAVHGKDNVLLAIFWLDTFEGRSARVHFCTFKPAFGQAAALGRECMSRVLQMKYGGEYLFECLIGVTPAENKLALRALKKAGLVTGLTIPSMLYNAYTDKTMDAVISYCTRREVCE